MPNTMNAALITHYQQAFPTIQQVPIPTITANDVLVKIVAASINPIDLKIKAGGLKLLLPYQMPLILGNDFAGIITKVGANVSQFKVGEAIYGRVPKDHIGTFAEYIAVDPLAITHKPQQLSFEEAAAIPLVGLTSYQALHDLMQLQPGQKVLIQAGSGGVGTIAIQIAKALGAYVATTTSKRNFELVKSLGADQVIDYRSENFQDLLTDYDAVFDTQGGQILKNAFQIIKPGGHIVSVAGTPNASFAQAYGLPLWKRLLFQMASHPLTKLAHQARANYHFLFMQPSGQQLALISNWLENGTIKPVIDQIIPFSEITTAFKESQAGHATGKIILKISDVNTSNH